MTSLRSASPPIRDRWNDVWGDGFVDDAWQSIVKVSDVDLCDDDELTLFFPNLARQPDKLRLRCLRMLERGRRSGQEHPARLAGGVRPIFGETRECLDSDIAIEVSIERSADGWWQDLDDELPDDPTLEAFAFDTGLHPAYIWRAAETRHEHFTVFTWLGHLARRRPALMPHPVAATILMMSGSQKSKASFAIALAQQGISHRELLRAAERRLGGERVILRPKPKWFRFGRWRALRRCFEGHRWNFT